MPQYTKSFWLGYNKLKGKVIFNSVHRIDLVKYFQKTLILKNAANDLILDMLYEMVCNFKLTLSIYSLA